MRDLRCLLGPSVAPDRDLEGEPVTDRPVRILLVEDIQEDVLMVREALRVGQLEVEVHQAGTLLEALEELASGERPDVILLDLNLPDAEGLTTVRRVAAAAGTIPIVILTGHDDEALAVQAVQEGAQDYLVKGVGEASRLTRSIRYAIERTRTEALLQASRAYFRSLTDKASDVVLVLDAEGRVRYVSRSIERVLGLRPEEREGRSALELVHPEDAPRVGQALAEGLRTPGARARVEARLKDVDGRWVWIEATGVNLTDDPSVRGVLVTWRDITGRRQAEEHIRFQARLLDAVGQAVFAQELDGTVTYWGAGAERVFGWTREEALGRRSADLVLPDLGEARESIDAGESFRDELVLRRRDGSPVVVDVVGTPLTDPTGRVVGMVGVATDISDRRAAETALRESERRFRALIENAAEAVLVLSPDARLRYASPAARRLLGEAWERGSAAWAGAVHPEDLERLNAAWLEALEAGADDVVAAEVRASDPEGVWRDLEVSLRNLLDVGGVEGVVVHARDVTGSRDLEQRLRQAQRLEAVGRLAGGIAHDFNNIVTGMKGFVRLVLEDLPADAPWRRDLEEVERLGARAADLTRQLLAFSRRQVLKPRVVDLRGVIEETQRMLRRVIGEDVEMDVRLGEQPCPAAVDPAQMEQVVLNLVMNARDAMPRGGRLTLATGHARLDERGARQVGLEAGPATYPFIRVEDTGHGMAAEVRKQAFEPFFTTKEPGRGTGLGLSTVFGIVKQSGGGVTLESAPGRGTSVTVYLPPAPMPLAADEAEDALANGVPPDDAPPGIILVVEDDPAVRVIVERILRRSGYQVTAAANGEEALEGVRRTGQDIALVVSDLVMPGMGGRELLRRMRALDPELPVLFMSGYSSDEVDRQGASREPGEWFLEKPFTPEELQDKVREALVGTAGVG